MHKATLTIFFSLFLSDKNTEEHRYAFFCTHFPCCLAFFLDARDDIETNALRSQYLIHEHEIEREMAIVHGNINICYAATVSPFRISFAHENKKKTTTEEAQHNSALLRREKDDEVLRMALSPETIVNSI